MSSQKYVRFLRRHIAMLCMLSVLIGINTLRLMNSHATSLQDLSYGTYNEIGGITPMQHRRPKLADNCYHIFIDAGANIGMHTRFLLEPSLYPKAWVARKFFVAHFGPEALRDNRDFCIFAFEPNPSHMKRHAEMTDAYSKMGWRYYFFPVGVGDKNGNMTFYNVGDDLGFTAVQKRSCKTNGCPQQQVLVYRLSDWIEREVYRRKIPTHAYGGKGYVTGPRVVMKMDIEMLEWLVMPDLITSGVLCRDIDGVMGEYHLEMQWYLYPVTFPDPAGNGLDWTLQNYTVAKAFMNEMLGMIERNYNCKTQLEMRDDESHADDGMPWPKPPKQAV